MTHRQKTLRVAETTYDPGAVIPVTGGRFDPEPGVRYETTQSFGEARDTTVVVNVSKRDDRGIYRWTGSVKIPREAGTSEVVASELVRLVGEEMDRRQAA